ncbi:hypothetical protein [Nocardioides sp.]|uniref:hypothetical protein n=1 Tax=Nocardioides sp. TaxID=35761 RepID=UPI0035619596
MTDPTLEGSALHSPGLTRRRVVKTAGHAAWAAPVIVVATSAPALAVSTNGGIDVVNLTAVRTTNTVNVSGYIKNHTGAAANGSKSVSFVVTGVPTPTSPVNDSGGAWSMGAVTTTPTGFNVSFSRTANLAAGATSASPFLFHFTSGNAGTGSGNVTGVVTVPANAGNDPGSANYS